MARWQVQQAKARLSEVIDEAERKGPQLITRHGLDRAVLISIEDFRSLTADKPDLRTYLLGGPKVPDFAIKRSRDAGREIAL
jgi:prevent-host-death family protein